MRIESSVTAISWIPSEAIQGMPKIPFELGIGHYDETPPDHLERGDLPRLRDEDRFREANDLRAWIEVEDGKIVDHGHEGDGYVGTTTFKLGPKDLVFQGVAFDVLRPETEVRDGEARFVQTVGGRAGFPAPRRVKGAPFFRIDSALTALPTMSSSAPVRSRGTSSTTATATSPRRPAQSTSRRGTGKRTATTRPGATRIRSRSSPRRSRPSSASFRPRS
jgi:hypothetical protein